MAVLIHSDGNWATKKNRDEWLISSTDELAELPDTVGPGSVAYTADMSYIGMMDEAGEWQEIGAGEEAAADTTEET